MRMRMRIMGLLGAGMMAAAMMLLAPVDANASGKPCSDTYGNKVPGCQLVTVVVNLSFDQTKGWALYCPSSAPYYWGGYSDVWQSRWHIFSENLFDEAGNLGKADFLLTNTRAGKNSVTITIGCSPVNQNGSCTTSRQVWSDPGCPESDRRLVCTGGGEDEQCWQEWDEECLNGTTVTDYSCTQALFGTFCTSC